MKKALIIFAASIMSLSANAQTLQDGTKMYDYERYRKAESILSPLAAADPAANYYLGLSYLKSGDVDKASQCFAKYPDDIANISGTARVAFAKNDVTKGMQIAKDLAAKARKKEWEPLKYAADAVTYSTGGDYNQAILWYQDALKKNPDNASLHIGLGDAFRKIPGGGGQAMDNYEAVTEKDMKNSLAFSRIGDLWYEARNTQSALDNYGHAKDADNSNPLPYKSLAYAYTRSGNYQNALLNVRAYLPLSDSTLNDRLEYLRILFLAQSFCDAAKTGKDMQNSAGLTQQNKIELTGIIGYSLASCGDSTLALQYLRQYFSMQDPKKILPNDYINYGKLLMKLDMIDSASYYYQKGVANDTSQNKTDIYRQIAEAFKDKKDYCKSADWYDNLVKANPNTQAYDYAYRGIMYYYCHSYDKATTAFSEFAAKYPDQPSAPFWQGRTAQVIDSDATTGGAVPFFVKWLDMVGTTSQKKNDLRGAYEYLMFYYYNSKQKDNEELYKGKIKAIDPDDAYVKQIDDAEKQAAKHGKK